MIISGRNQLTRSEQLLAADTRRNAHNMLASAKLLALVVVVSLAMGVAAWAFLASLDIATDYRESMCGSTPCSPSWAWPPRGSTRTTVSPPNAATIWSSTPPGHTTHHARMAILTFVCSTLTHLTGGSAGREGAAVQIGGTIASNVSSLAHLKKHDHHDLMLAGISSAFGAVFGSPLAGAFFGMEMCFIGKIDYTAGIYCLVASFTGYFTSLAWAPSTRATSSPAFPT